MVSKACLVGAYQRKLEEIARHQDVELTVAVPPSWRDERGELPLERAYTTGYDLVVEPIRFNGHFHAHYYPRLGRLISHIRPDLVHIDEEPYNFATAHATWLSRRIGSRTLFFSWQNLKRHYPVPFRWFEHYVLSRADYGLVGNQAAHQVWRDKGYKGPLSVIPQFGVDPEIFKPAKEIPDPGRGFVIGYVGRFVPEKGVDVLVEAVASLPGAWQLALAGSGPDQGELERRARFSTPGCLGTALTHAPQLDGAIWAGPRRGYGVRHCGYWLQQRGDPQRDRRRWVDLSGERRGRSLSTAATFAGTARVSAPFG